jgi:hypothetical protein
MTTEREAPTLTNEMWIALKKAERKGFWGQVSVDYRDGKPVCVRLNETMQIQENTRERQEEPQTR